MTLFASCIRWDATDKYILIWEAKSEYTLYRDIHNWIMDTHN